MLLSFSANSISPEILEKTLVGRKEVLGQIEQELVEKSMQSYTYQSLMVAPRGSGKTHITSLLRYRIKANKKLDDKVLVAYMNEDERGIANFSDFIRHIILSFIRHKEGGYEGLNDLIFEVSGLPVEKQEKAFVNILLEYIGNKILVILIENLNILFDEKRGMGEDGQRKLRSLIHEHNQFSIFATSQNLFHQIQNPGLPFYNFFKIRHLKKLTFEETFEFVKIQALLENDENIEKELDKPEFKGKVRAIYQLTGGNHRLLVIFFSFLKAEIKSDLSKVFQKTMNDLKPYYEQFLNALSPQQQKIIQFLSSHHTPQMGRTISRYCFIDSKILSKQTSELERKGFLDKNRVGKDAYYELKEALMRICFEINEKADGVVKLFVDFLSGLFSQPVLQKRFLEFKYQSIKIEDIGFKRKYEDETKLYRKAIEPAIAEMLDSVPIESCMSREQLDDVINDALLKIKTTNKADKIDSPKIDLNRFEEMIGITLKEFKNLVANSLSLTLDEKEEMYGEIPELKIEQIKGLAVVFKEEKEKLIELFLRDEDLYQRIIIDEDVDKNKLYFSLDFFEKLKLEKEFENKAALFFHIGNILFENDEFGKALASLNKAIELEPTKAVCHYRLGLVLNNLKKYEQALLSFGKAVNLDPEDAEYHYWKGQTFRNLGKYERTLSSFEKAIGLDPGNAEYYYWQGQTFDDLKKDESALSSFEKAIGLDPENAEYHYWQGRTFRNLGKYEPALLSFEKAINLDPENAEYHYRQGKAFYNFEKYEPALLSFEKAIGLDPENANYHYWQGQTFHDFKKYKEALLPFEKSIGLDPENAEYHYWQGRIFRDLKKYKPAFSSIEKAINLDPDNADYYNGKGMIYLEMNDMENARTIFTQGLSIEKNNWYLNGSLCQAYIRINDLEKSKNQFKKVCTLASEENPLPGFLEEDVLSPILKYVDLKFAKKYLKFLINILRKKNLLPELWKAFPQAIFHLLINIEEYQEKRLGEILELLKTEFADYKEMVMPLLYLDIGIRFLKKGDQRAIYDFSKEERQVFKDFVLDKRK